MASLIKNFCLLLILPLIVFAADAQIKSDRETYDLKGKVKTYRLERALSTDGKEGQRKPWQHMVFDERGNYLEYTIYSNDYPRTYKFVSRYVTGGNILETTREGSGEKVIFVYHPKERQIEKFTQTNDGHVLDKWIYTFDETGNKTKEEHITVDKDLGQRLMKPIDVITFNYDSQGRPSEEEYFNEDGSKATNPIVPIHKKVFVYNQENRKSEIMTYKLDGSLFNKQVIKYNERGGVAEITTYSASLSPVSHETYSAYDANGNWGKKVISNISKKDGKTFEPTQVLYQIITYY